MPFKITAHFSKTPPPMPTRIKNLAGAIVATAKGVAAGQPLIVDATEKEKRIEICRECEQWFDWDRNICTHSKCGCYMRLKPWLHSQHCPENKW